MTSPDYKDRIETELQHVQDEEETLLLITRGAAGPKIQLEKDYYIRSIYLWTEKGEQHAIISIFIEISHSSLYL